MVTVGALLFTASLAAQTTLTVDGSQKGPQINPSLYGLFFEEINHAGDGGLYAELIRNRSFEDSKQKPEAWKTIAPARIVLINKGLLNKAQGQALRVILPSSVNAKSPAGISNGGFWGIHAVKGRNYTLNFWCRSAGAYKGKITALLQNADGTKTYAKAVAGRAGKNWKKLSVKLISGGDDPQARLTLLFDGAGTVDVDVVSLFPPTFKNRPNGLRPDLAQMLADLHPAFLRFPGGCYVEGVKSIHDAFQWRRTIGPIEQRPGHPNMVWGYRSSDGLGFDEYLQLCEDVHAAPLFVVNIGLGHEYYIPVDSLQPYIKDVMDALEYANGAASTPMGALRAKNGHAQPYGIKYIELGNENYQTGNEPRSREYPERYEMYRKAILARYPQMKIIGNVEAWGTDSPSWRNGYAVDFLDEHYYRSYSWMRANFTKYDSYVRGKNYRIYNGEYAANAAGTYGKNGTIQSALGEAIYMLGMERNADICAMASFAPIFTHENNRAWDYDMIHFTASKSFATPSYYVQKLMADNLGLQTLKIQEDNNEVSPVTNLRAGLGTWKTKVKFGAFAILNGDGVFMAKDNFTSQPTQWMPEKGSWQEGGQAYAQQSMDENCTSLFREAVKASSYEIDVDAEKTEGNEGFLILFNYENGKNFYWWNIGGWGNTGSGLECNVDGSKTTYDRRAFSVEAGRKYHIRLLVNGNNIIGFIDGKEMLRVSLPVYRAVYAAAALDSRGDTLILKIVNPENKMNSINLNFKNLNPVNGTIQQLKGEGASAENTLSDPLQVVPMEETSLSGVGAEMKFNAPPFSLSVLRLSLKE